MKVIIHEISEDYALPIGGDHGVEHWARTGEDVFSEKRRTATRRPSLCYFKCL